MRIAVIDDLDYIMFFIEDMNPNHVDSLIARKWVKISSAFKGVQFIENIPTIHYLSLEAAMREMN